MAPVLSTNLTEKRLGKLVRAGMVPVRLIFSARLMVLSSALWMPGCGGSAPTTPVAETSGGGASAPDGSGASVTETSDPTSVTSAQSPASGASNKPHRQNERWKDENGVEYLGNVPLDVFFDQPYAVASDLTPLNGASGAATTSAAPGGTQPMIPSTISGDSSSATSAAATSTPAGDGAASGGGWDTLIPMAEIDREITDIRNFLTEALQNVGAYNRSMLMIPPKAAAAGILAAIVTQHPEDISWKEDAAYIRNFAKKMNESTLQPGKKDQDRLKSLFENMADTLNRSRPAGVEEPPADDTFADVAEMRYVMMRMEDAEKKMKTEVASADAFTAKKQMVQHEAVMMRAMTHAVILPGYGYDDDADFKAYATTIEQASDEIIKASEAGDYDTFTLSLSKISTACQGCHSVYKNN